MSTKRKMLLYGDSPIATTGLGRQHRYLLREFSKDFDITIIGLNHQDVNVTPNGVIANFDHELYPYDIFSTYLSEDKWGINAMKEILKDNKFDVIFTSHDINRITPFINDILQHRMKYGSKWILYTPIDRLNVLDGEEKIFTMADKTVFLSRYALNKIKEKGKFNNISFIHLPLDLKDFPEVPQTELDSWRKDYFKWSLEDFIISNINRNQFRKDLGRTAYAFKKLGESMANIKLYLHTKQSDEGGDLGQNLIEMGLKKDKVLLADINSPAMGITQQDLNKIYRSSNLIVSTTKGEGFGYSTVEAMACKIPVLVPNNTSQTELIGEDQERGYLVDCKEWVIDYGISNCMRKITDVDDMVSKMRYIIENYKEAKDKTEKAFDFVATKLNPDFIYKQWKEIFDSL